MEAFAVPTRRLIMKLNTRTKVKTFPNRMVKPFHVKSFANTARILFIYLTKTVLVSPVGCPRDALARNHSRSIVRIAGI